MHVCYCRTKKVVVAPNKSTFVSNHDPYLVENITETLFPKLSLERGGGGATGRMGGAFGPGTTTLHLQSLYVGDNKTVLLPSLSVDQNYPQMLSEVVANIWCLVGNFRLNLFAQIWLRHITMAPVITYLCSRTNLPRNSHEFDNCSLFVMKFKAIYLFIYAVCISTVLQTCPADVNLARL